jgi:nucleoside-diphosphate kinase
MEKTLVLIKPDAVSEGLVGKIIDYYEMAKIKIVCIKMLYADKQLLEAHYEDHRGRVFFNDVVAFMMSGPIIAMVLEGDDAIERVRTINGKTDPKEAAAGTIRGDFGQDIRHNLVHGSDGLESAKREINLWFADQSLRLF